MRALLAMPEDLPGRIFNEEQHRHLTQLVDLGPYPGGTDFARVDPEWLRGVEILLTGWGSPRVDDGVLEALPALRAIVHTAGSVRPVAGDAVWEREDIVVTSAAQANAIPVVEFTLAHILLAGKRTIALEAAHRRLRTRGAAFAEIGCVGNHGAVVGLIGASRIGRLVAERLRGFDLRVLLYDPTVPPATIEELGARPVELSELMRGSDVVSLHAPDVPSTRGMLGAEHFALLADGATFINTARSALVDRDALRAELLTGRISAVLDVEDDLDPEDPLWDAPTVSLTPHIAGSKGNELFRLGASALEEVRRLVVGEPARFPERRIDRQLLA
ncbi:hydroxyacid dehydrogenase [Brachybacterium alimentarium]|uniref:hydroxyacid dehydrogenase n=1 Tax=Brachybacterium alimentarium TaxID=47845 RepID=UPI003FCF6E49